MKEKIIIFTLGLLSGAIIATGAILVYTLVDNSSNTNAAQMDSGQIPTTQGAQAPTGQAGTGSSSSTTPPERPSGETQTNTQAN